MTLKREVEMEKLKLEEKVVRRKVRRHFFSAQVVDKRNSLEKRIVEAKR